MPPVSGPAWPILTVTVSSAGGGRGSLRGFGFFRFFLAATIEGYERGRDQRQAELTVACSFKSSGNRGMPNGQQTIIGPARAVVNPPLKSQAGRPPFAHAGRGLSRLGRDPSQRGFPIPLRREPKLRAFRESEPRSPRIQPGDILRRPVPDTPEPALMRTAAVPSDDAHHGSRHGKAVDGHGASSALRLRW